MHYSGQSVIISVLCFFVHTSIHLRATTTERNNRKNYFSQTPFKHSDNSWSYQETVSLSRRNLLIANKL